MSQGQYDAVDELEKVCTDQQTYQAAAVARIADSLDKVCALLARIAASLEGIEAVENERGVK